MKKEAQKIVAGLLSDTKAGYLLWHETTRQRQGYTAERVGEWFFLDSCGRYLEVHVDKETPPSVVPEKGLLPLLEEVEVQWQNRAIRDRIADVAWIKAEKRQKSLPRF